MALIIKSKDAALQAQQIRQDALDTQSKLRQNFSGQQNAAQQNVAKPTIGTDKLSEALQNLLKKTEKPTPSGSTTAGQAQATTSSAVVAAKIETSDAASAQTKAAAELIKKDNNNAILSHGNLTSAQILKMLS